MCLLNQKSGLIIFSFYLIFFVLQYCVLSPVKWSDLRKSKSMDPDLHHLHRPSAVGGAYQPELLSSGLLSSSSSLSSFSDAGRRTSRVSDLLFTCLSCDPLSMSSRQAAVCSGLRRPPDPAAGPGLSGKLWLDVPPERVQHGPAGELQALGRRSERRKQRRLHRCCIQRVRSSFGGGG